MRALIDADSAAAKNDSLIPPTKPTGARTRQQASLDLLAVNGEQESANSWKKWGCYEIFQGSCKGESCRHRANALPDVINKMTASSPAAFGHFIVSGGAVNHRYER